MDNSEFSVSNYPVMKDSGVEWLGEIPVEWEVKKLRYIVNLKSGNNLTANQIKEDGAYPVYGGNGLRGYYHEFTHEGDFILIGRQGALCGNINYPASKFWATDHAVVVEPLSDYKLVWLGEVLRIMNLNQYSVAAAQPGLSVETICNLFIPWPLLEEQTAIANFLDRKIAEIDALIAQKERLLELYEEEKTAIINHAVTKGLDPNAELKDSGVEWLGEIPVGWEIKKLKYGVSKVGSGVTPSGGASIYQLSGIPLLRSQNIHVDGIKMDDVAYIDEELHDSMSNSKVQAGDVLLNITGASIGRCFYVEENFGEANVNQHVCIIRPNGKIKTSYLYFVLRSDLGEEQIKIEQTGSGREGLNFEALNNFIIPYLSVEEQTAIANFLDRKMTEIDTKIAKTQRIIELQKEYRTALISDVVTGKIKVSHLAGEEAAR